MYAGNCCTIIAVNMHSSTAAQPQPCAPNAAALQELERLDEDSTVYKQIGPAMIKQDLVEAQTNVSKRLEFIQVMLPISQQQTVLPTEQSSSGCACVSPSIT